MKLENLGFGDDSIHVEFDLLKVVYISSLKLIKNKRKCHLHLLYMEKQIPDVVIDLWCCKSGKFCALLCFEVFEIPYKDIYTHKTYICMFYVCTCCLGHDINVQQKILTFSFTFVHVGWKGVNQEITLITLVWLHWQFHLLTMPLPTFLLNFPYHIEMKFWISIDSAAWRYMKPLKSVQLNSSTASCRVLPKPTCDTKFPDSLWTIWMSTC